MVINTERETWGDASEVDITVLLYNVVAQFNLDTSYLQPQSIHVKHSGNGPIVLYRSCVNEDYTVLLSSTSTNWCQYVYQFAHEFCHIISNYETLKKCLNSWFHESLCELASLFVLRRMGIQWEFFPPYPNWRDYRHALLKYGNAIIDKTTNDLPLGEISLLTWLSSNEPKLRVDEYDRELNRVIAVKLLPLFESCPAIWETLQHLPNSSSHLIEYLSEWYDVTPDGKKPLLGPIIEIFNK